MTRLVAAVGLALLAACGSGGGGRPAPATPAGEVVAILEGTTLFVDVLADHPAVSGPGSTVTITAQPEHGAASVEPDRRIRYVADASWNGADTLLYEVQPSGGSALASSVTVTAYEALTAGAPAVNLPKTALTAREIGVVVNDSDPQSVAVAAYYAAQRHIPAGNVVHLAFPTGATAITAVDFTPLKVAVDTALSPEIQALVLTWTTPLRVDGMGITSAFALGFSTAYENTSGGACDLTLGTPYFDSDSARPFTDHGIRPTMMLAGENTANVLALIDRGVASDDTFPAGTGHLVRTTDPARSVRWPSMEQAITDWNHPPDGLSLVYHDNSAGGGSDVVTGATGVLFYLTGLASVSGIGTNAYAPGAVADHLTSYAGILTGGSGQMSALRWLEAGVTASSGTVVEPCNFTEKFPDPGILISRYYRGETVLEAYWKSVAWPGENVFVGEPLARPFGRAFLSFSAARTLTIQTTSLLPGRSYDLLAADAPAGPFAVALSGISVAHHEVATITLGSATRAVYELRPH